MLWKLALPLLDRHRGPIPPTTVVPPCVPRSFDVGTYSAARIGLNQNPKVFVWSAPVERIMARMAKCKGTLHALH
jgi:hypothetical protein